MENVYGKSPLILILGAALAIASIFLGFIFTVAAFTPGKIYRLFVGIPLLLAGFGLIFYLLKPEPKILTVSVRWDPSGKVVVEELKCPYCGAPLPEPEPGEEYLKCTYCGKTVKIVEEPIW